MHKKSVVIFSHRPPEGPARLVNIFDQYDFAQDVILTPEYDLDSFDPLTPDLLVVMGGTMGVYEAEKYPYLLKEIEIFKARIASGKPLLGICLGCQLIAKALGAQVYKGDRGFERGWHPLRAYEAGKGSLAENLCAPNATMLHWHQDTFDFPEGATLLAGSETYPHQIFSYGQNAQVMAIQCHPEVEENQLKDWAGNLSCEEEKLKILNDSRNYMEDMDRSFRTFMKEWLMQQGLI